MPLIAHILPLFDFWVITGEKLLTRLPVYGTM